MVAPRYSFRKRYVRRRDLPKDIDIVLDLQGLPAMDNSRALTMALQLRFEHDQLFREYHVDVWARHPLLPVDLAAYFQYAGLSAAAELRIDERHPKGILRIQA